MRRPAYTTGKGVLQLCFDMGLRPDQTAIAQHHELGQLAYALSQALDRSDLPATWGVANPNLSFVSEAIGLDTTRHEIALLVDSSADVRSRLAEAKRTGVNISTLICRTEINGIDSGRLSKRGITAVSSPASFDQHRRYSRGLSRVEKGHGILEFTPSALFPGRGRWLAAADAAFAAKKILLRAIHTGSTEQLRLHVHEMLERPASYLKAFSRFLSYVVRLRQAGRLEVESVRASTLRHCPATPGKSARSILRPAA